MRRAAAFLLGLAASLAAGGAHARDAVPCREGEGIRIWTSPREPSSQGALRVMAVGDAFDGAELALLGPGGEAWSGKVVRRGGPPWSLTAIADKPGAGWWRAEVRRAGVVVSCRAVDVVRRPASSVPPPAGRSVWTAKLTWDKATEDFYSAWIEALFDAPPEASLSWKGLFEGLRDPARNFLWNHMGWGEDDARGKATIPAVPDCADMPYFLRAVFAWKVGLPMGFRDCNRGNEDHPPRCADLATHESPPEAADALSAFKKFLRQLMNKVQSGSARTALDDDATDLYPLPLVRDALRPGTVYADPYGHTLMIVKWVAQTAEHSGLLLAVDAQPDNSVARKRFWEGTFLFTTQTRSAGPGFKAFRPLVRAGQGDDARFEPAGNAALVHDARGKPYGDEQARLSTDEFYARMGKVINPDGVDPVRAYEDTLDALVEQLQTRVGSVDNGETFIREKRNPVVPMPDGSKIFETTGPWEDYATPSRDMRLLIAMNVLLGLPERIVRHPELYRLAGRKPEAARAEVEALHARRIAERAIEYRRSDGSLWRLTVADVLARRAGFEMAYNPNDCVETRWAAPDGSPERSTCQRRAPADQRAKMDGYRAWFHETRRPPR